MAGAPPPQSNRPDPRSLQWLVDTWKQSSDWAGTRPATRKQRENLMVRVIDASGNPPFKAITKDSIRELREAMQDRPAAADNMIKTFRALYRWAEDAGHVDDNPAMAVRFIGARSDGFTPWTRDDLDKYREHWPLGTRERVAIEVLITTGLRRGDACRLGRPHLKAGVFMIRTEKTGTPVYRPLLPELAAAIEAGPVGELTFITGANGAPMVKESFGNWFRKACTAAKVSGSAHGVRKLAATIMAERGATESELKAAFGWTTSDMASLYTRAADRQRLAIAGVLRLASGADEG
jgi:integrase